ncbi:unnamed protein product, partial [Ectocarpus fasciculatus]
MAFVRKICKTETGEPRLSVFPKCARSMVRCCCCCCSSYRCFPDVLDRMTKRLCECTQFPTNPMKNIYHKQGRDPSARHTHNTIETGNAHRVRDLFRSTGLALPSG